MSSLHLKESPTLAELQQYVADMVKERDFRDNIQGRFMLLLEEIGEFAKASRKQAGLKLADNARDTNVAHEAADVLLLFVGLCNLLDIDLAQALHEKEAINKTRTWQ